MTRTSLKMLTDPPAIRPFEEVLKKRPGRAQLIALDPPRAPAGPDPVEEARREAELEGLKAAQQKVEAILHRYLDSIDRLNRAAHDRARPFAAEIVDLALVVAREVVQRELSIDRDALVDGIAGAIAEAAEDEPLRIRMNAADLAFLRKRRPEILRDGIELVEDARLAVGGYVIEARDRVIDATIERRIESVRGALVTLLDQPDALAAEDAEIEEDPC